MINWKVRFKNKLFIFQLIAAIFVPILAYFGMNIEDVTTWGILGRLLLDAISNPYVLMLVAVSVYNAITDPTTAGNRDSSTALRYTKPKKEGKVRGGI